MLDCLHVSSYLRIIILRVPYCLLWHFVSCDNPCLCYNSPHCTFILLSFLLLKQSFCLYSLMLDRMYGALTGLSKQMVAQRHGLDTLKKWRRGYANRPPPISSFSNIYPGKYVPSSLQLYEHKYLSSQLSNMPTFFYSLPFALTITCIGDCRCKLTLLNTCSQEMMIDTYRTYWMYDTQCLNLSSAPLSMAGWNCTENSQKLKA